MKSGYSLNYNCKTNRHIWLVNTIKNKGCLVQLIDSSIASAIITDVQNVEPYSGKEWPYSGKEWMYSSRWNERNVGKKLWKSLNIFKSVIFEWFTVSLIYQYLSNLWVICTMKYWNVKRVSSNSATFHSETIFD